LFFCASITATIASTAATALTSSATAIIAIAATTTASITSILLTSPIFFPEDMWIQGPNDWSFNLPSGKYYDTTNGEGKRIFAEFMERVLKQDSFRFAVEQAFQQCKIWFPDNPSTD
jgi:hypothetical protein